MADSSISKSGSKCTIDIRSEDGAALVKCKGRLVYGQTDILKEGVRDLLPKSKRVVIDLGEVDYMDSTAWVRSCTFTSPRKVRTANCNC